MKQRYSSESFFLKKNCFASSQAYFATRRFEEAVVQIENMLDTQIVCAEPDHFDKIVEGVQVVANVLLPDQAARYSRIKNAASALFPSVAARLDAVQKQSGGCAIM